jgi:hypothetical protein
MKVNILGEAYTVTYHKEYLIQDGEDHIGLCDTEAKVIQISTIEPTKPTLLHEMVHAIAEEGGLSKSGITAEQWEIVCEQVEKVMTKNWHLKLKARRY